MDERERRIIDEYIRQMEQKKMATVYSSSSPLYGTTMASSKSTAATATAIYSLAEVQLKGGSVIAMTISAGPALAQRLIAKMKETGFLTLFNENESLTLRAEDVVAVKLTKMTME